MIKVFDNIFPPEIEDHIEQEVLSQQLGRYDNLSYTKSKFHNNNLPSLPQYGVGGSKFKGDLNLYLRKILKLTKNQSNIDFGEAIRWKINKLKPIPSPEISKWGIHIDSFLPHYSIIYYVNNCDGDTVFYNNTLGNKYSEWEEIKAVNEDLSYWTEMERVSPKKGRIVIFDGDIFHHSSYPTSEGRYVINFNVEISNKTNQLI